MAVPEGVAMIGLGISLWRSRGLAGTPTEVESVTTQTVALH